MTCQDCVHYDVCKTPTICTDFDAKHCCDFKDKSEWVHLPCKVGDTVYMIFEDYDEEGDKSFVCDVSVESFLYDGVLYVIVNSPLGYKGSRHLRIGQNVFMTSEEADKALERKME